MMETLCAGAVPSGVEEADGTVRPREGGTGGEAPAGVAGTAANAGGDAVAYAHHAQPCGVAAVLDGGGGDEAVGVAERHGHGGGDEIALLVDRLDRAALVLVGCCEGCEVVGADQDAAGVAGDEAAGEEPGAGVGFGGGEAGQADPVGAGEDRDAGGWAARDDEGGAGGVVEGEAGPGGGVAVGVEGCGAGGDGAGGGGAGGGDLDGVGLVVGVDQADHVEAGFEFEGQAVGVVGGQSAEGGGEGACGEHMAETEVPARQLGHKPGGGGVDLGRHAARGIRGPGSGGRAQRVGRGGVCV